MRIELLDEDTTLADLSARIHGKKLKKQPALTDRLAALNPHLSDPLKIPKGTPILVPEDDEPASDARLVAAVAVAQRMLDDAAAVRQGRLGEHAAAVEERLALIKSARPGLTGDTALLGQLDDLEKKAKKATTELKREKEENASQLDVLRKSAAESAPSGRPVLRTT